jgi:pimeloyl-ACP methyl ester carboxylesterase
LPGRTVFVGDDEFMVREMGPMGDVPTLLIHGLAGSSLAEWYQVAPKLAVDRRVIMIDHRGHGLSAPGDRRFDIEDDADELAAVLDAMGVGQVDVVGYSMGGVIAQSLARRHPGRVRRLVLLATFAAHSETYRWFRRVGAILARGWERVIGVGTPEIRSGYLILRHAIKREHARWIWRETRRRDVESGSQATFALLRFDSREWLGRLAIESMVVVPTNDLLVPPKWQHELVSRLQRARLVELEGAGHEIVWTHADQIADEISSFLA